MKLVYGVGVNDHFDGVHKIVNGNPVKIISYTSWVDMIRRCYSAAFQEKYPTYKGSSVCEEWKSFKSFKSWFDVNHVDGWSLSVCILSGSRIYSPENCIYVPEWLNNFTLDHSAKRGANPIGVTFIKSKGKFRAKCRVVGCGQEHIGYFQSADEASSAYKQRKLEIAAEKKLEMDVIDARIYPRVVEIIRAAK